MPLFLIIAIAIKLDSPGPIIYKSTVVGNKGPFVWYKFRTMIKDAEKLKKRLWDKNEAAWPMFKMKDDPRITKVGKILRRFFIDESPQFFNVLKGDASIIGPRPPDALEYKHFTEFQKKKLQVKSGIVCLWQVSKNHKKYDSFDDWVREDLRYIESMSFALDLKIMFKTIWHMLSGKGL